MKKTMMILALVAFAALPVVAQTAVPQTAAPQTVAPAAQPEVQVPLQSSDLTDQAACNSTIAELVAPASTNKASCPDAARAYYYSDATYTTQVGTCWHACCQLWSCTGEITAYYTVFTHPCNFN